MLSKKCLLVRIGFDVQELLNFKVVYLMLKRPVHADIDVHAKPLWFLPISCVTWHVLQPMG